MELTGTAAYDGVAVEGTFAWAEPTVRPRGADNGKEMYRVVFTPDDTQHYSTTETLIALDVQSGVKIVVDMPDTIEYMGLEITRTVYNHVDSSTGLNFFGTPGPVVYCVDADTGEFIRETYPSGLVQSQLTPGIATLTLPEDENRVISGIDMEKYFLVNTGASDTFEIVKSNVSFDKMLTIYVDAGTKLGDIDMISLVKSDKIRVVSSWQNYKSTLEGDGDLYGSLVWENPDTMLYTTGLQYFNLTFQPDDTNLYNPVTVSYPVQVNAGRVLAPEFEPLVYNGARQYPDIPDNELYTVVKNEGGIDAGFYTVTLKLNKPESFWWEGDYVSLSGDEVTVGYTIEKADLSVRGLSTAKVEPLGYGEKLKDSDAQKMIKGVTVINPFTNETVNGTWGWQYWDYDESSPLFASAKNQDKDLGN